MNSILSSFSGLPKPLQATLQILGGASVAAVLLPLFMGKAMISVWLIAGLAFVVVLMLIYRAILGWRKKAKATPFAREIAESQSAVPQGAGQAAARARLDDLRKKFEKGMATFRAHGKNLYAMPWYIIVGEPGSGKTEAIRHCNIGFPPGLQDELQGAGGTVNMDWWFTDHAVILDTAGRLILEEVESSSTGEWKEFLKLLSRHRPNCPVNGMLLAIPADSLIRDTADTIERKAGRISRQLDNIQRALGVRFPVFVVITKSDLINGFREFFDDIDDPQLQHQMFGWSNSEPLDQEFKPEAVDKAVSQIRERLLRRRFNVLRDPVHTEDESARRIDQVDSLFAFPDSLVALAPRLRRYLEMIFVGGTWATKPLFLRGIYFTSSMREGSELDEELAKIHGVAVESLPGGGSWARDKAYFLRDVFLNKVFKERGLVTRASNTRQLQRRRRTVLIGSAAASLVLLIGMTAYSMLRLDKTVLAPKGFWAGAAEAYPLDTKYGGQWRPIVETRVDEQHYSGQFLLGDLPGYPKSSLAGGALAVYEEARRPLDVPWGFRIAGGLSGGGAANLSRDLRLDAAHSVFENSILKPIVVAARTLLKAEKQWSPQAAEALVELVRLEIAAANGRESQSSPEGTQRAIPRLLPLVQYIEFRRSSEPVTAADQADLTKLQEAVDWLYGSDVGSERRFAANREAWPAVLAAGTADSHKHIDDAVRSFNARLGGDGGVHSDLRALYGHLEQLTEAEVALHGLAVDLAAPPPSGAASIEQWQQRLEKVQHAATQVDQELDRLGFAGNVNWKISKDNTERADRDRKYLREIAKLLAPLKLDDAANSTDQRKYLARLKQDVEALPAETSGSNRLDEIQAAHLDRATGAQDQRRYRVRLSMYGRADALRGPTAAENANGSGAVHLYRTLASLDEAQRESRTQIEASSSLLPDAPLSKGAKTVSLSALDRIAAQRRETDVRAFLAQLPGTREKLEQHIAAVVPAGDSGSSGSQTYEPIQLPAIPLTPLKSNPQERLIAAAYHPEAAAHFIKSWSAVDGLLNPASAPQTVTVLNQKELAADVKNKRAAVEAYCHGYAEYWSQKVYARSTPDLASFQSWEDFRLQLAALNPADVNLALRQLGETAEQGLALLDDMPITASDDWSKSRDRLKRELTVLRDRDGAFERICRDAIRKWSALPNLDFARESIRKARTNLFELNQEYLVLYAPVAGPDAKSVRYWNDLTLAMVRLLAGLTDAQAQSARKALTATQYRKFPLAWSAGQSLTRKEAQEAREHFAKIPRLGLARRESGTDQVFALLDTIEGKTDPDLELQRILKLEPVFDFLKPDLVCTIALVDDTDLRDRQPRFLVGGAVDANIRPGVVADYFPFFKVKFGQVETERAMRTRGADGNARQLERLSLKVPSDQAVTFSFYKSEPAQGPADATATLNADWTVLHALPAVAHDDLVIEGKSVTAPLLVTDTKGEKYFYWVKFTFNRELPKLADWADTGDHHQAAR